MEQEKRPNVTAREWVGKYNEATGQFDLAALPGEEQGGEKMASAMLAFAIGAALAAFGVFWLLMAEGRGSQGGVGRAVRQKAGYPLQPNAINHIALKPSVEFKADYNRIFRENMALRGDIQAARQQYTDLWEKYNAMTSKT